MLAALEFSPARPTKTYVVESHATDPLACLSELASARAEPLEDAFLFRVATSEGVLWVDQLDERFWRFHTDAGHSAVYPLLREWVSSRRDLDWMWLPSEHLRHVWSGAVTPRVRTDFRGGSLLGAGVLARDVRVQLQGDDAEQLLGLIAGIPEYRAALSFEGVQTEVSDPHFGSIREGVNRMGRFAASGDSPELHLQFVSTVVDRYRQLVELCEAKAIRWRGFDGYDGGGTVSGGPIVIDFSREVDDVGAFADELTSSREPFRLWGVASVSRGVAEIEAVDLHVGQPLQIDVGRQWMRIYLQEGTCGNTVARLISNLQHRFDGALTVKDPDLDNATRRPVGVGS
jgi:hypothetical protein